MCSKLSLSLVLGMMLAGQQAISSSPAVATNRACPTLRKVAQEVLKLELSGQRLPEFEKSCVRKMKSESIAVMHVHAEDQSYQAPTNPILVRSHQVAIQGIAKLEFPDRYRVEFTVKTGKETKKDSFVMETFRGESRLAAGCASMVTPPKDFFLFQGCEFKAASK